MICKITVCNHVYKYKLLFVVFGCFWIFLVCSSCLRQTAGSKLLMVLVVHYDVVPWFFPWFSHENHVLSPLIMGKITIKSPCVFFTYFPNDFVPIPYIFGLFFRAKFQGIYPQNMAWNMIPIEWFYHGFSHVFTFLSPGFSPQNTTPPLQHEAPSSTGRRCSLPSGPSPMEEAPWWILGGGFMGCNWYSGKNKKNNICSILVY